MTTGSAVPSLTEITGLEARHVLQTYRRQPVAFAQQAGVARFAVSSDGSLVATD